MLKHHTISFKNAFAGIKSAFRTQPNFRIHCFVAVCVIAAGWYVSFSPMEWALISFTILWVLLSEMINTAIESIVDLVTTEYRQQAKIAKDVAAGAVLLGAMGSIIIGCLLFIPKFL